MANYKKHGATGKMCLSRDWEESSSTHLEIFDDYGLIASEDGRNVILVNSSGTKNFIKPSASESHETKTQISVEELISLIQKNGKAI